MLNFTQQCTSYICETEGKMGSCQKSSSSHHSQLVFDAASLNYDEASTSTSSPGIMSTFEDTICAFCGIPLKPGAGVVLDKCLHNFCR